MPWYVKQGLLLAAVFALGLVGTWVVRFFRRPTLSAWSWTGMGVPPKALLPEEAALLLGLEPGTIHALLFFRLEAEGRVRLLAEKPITIEGIGAPPTSRLEKLFADALDQEGHLVPAGIVALLDALFDDVDGKMSMYSGQETTRFYEKKLSALLDRTLASDPPGTAAERPWMMLLDSGELWEGLGQGEPGQVLKTMFRFKERFRAEVLAMDAISEAARHPAGGFFAHRSDLRQAPASRKAGNAAARFGPYGW